MLSELCLPRTNMKHVLIGRNLKSEARSVGTFRLAIPFPETMPKRLTTFKRWELNSDQ